jgi:hypothetical protein
VLTVSVIWLVMHVLRTSERLAALTREPSPPLPISEVAPNADATLERLAAEVGKLNAAVERLPQSFEELRVSLTTATPALATPAAVEWSPKVAQELKQFRVLWTAFYGGHHQRLEPEFLADLQDAARMTADNLLALLAARPEEEQAPPQTALLAVVMSLQELAELEVDPEDARTLDDLDELGGRIVSQIDSLR